MTGIPPRSETQSPPTDGSSSRYTSWAYVDDETYRRAIKAIRNLQEGRHDLAGTLFHGRKGELYQRYHKGMEDQLGALGLVLNCVVLCYPG